MSGCLGAALAALVDGELDHAGRERVHRHLARCVGCRDEVEAQRRTKALLRTTGAPDPSDALRARLLELGASRPAGAVPGPERDGLLSHRFPPAAGAPSASRRHRDRAQREGRQGRRSAGARAAVAPGAGGARRAGAGSAFALLGVTAALALGAPPQRPAATPLPPAGAAFATQASSGLRAASPSHLRPAPALPFVPGARPALLTSAGTTGLLSPGAASSAR